MKLSMSDFPRPSAIRGASLRLRLTMAAAASLIVATAMTALVVGTAETARSVVSAVEQSHARNETFYRLQYAADVYQRATYADVRHDPARVPGALAAARAEFRSALRDTEALPERDAHDRLVALRVRRAGVGVETLFANGGRIVRQVDERWRSDGSIAALKEIQALSAPYFEMVAIATEEVRNGDRVIRLAGARAERIQNVALPAALAGMFLSILVSALVLLIVIFRLSPELRRLRDRTRRFAEGDLGGRIEIGGSDELAMLADAFNLMAEELQLQRAERERYTNRLEEAVQKRTTELERAHASLAERDARRRVFFAEIGHELRTPITIIQGEAQVALMSVNETPEELIVSMERIIGQTADLRRLVEDLFLIARAEASGLDLHLEAIDLPALIRQLATDFEPFAAARDSVIVVERSDAMWVTADRTRLRQILGALVNNAIRHSPAGVRVTLSLAPSGAMATIKVCDTGPGVDPLGADELLLRFRRGNTRAEGSGLGLAIARALTEAHGGTLSLANRPTGGLEVAIQLPLAMAEKQAGDEDGRCLASRGR